MNLGYAKLNIFRFKNTTVRQSRILKICRVKSISISLSFHVHDFKLNPLKPKTSSLLLKEVYGSFANALPNCIKIKIKCTSRKRSCNSKRQNLTCSINVTS